jgi:hypothetical protein
MKIFPGDNKSFQIITNRLWTMDYARPDEHPFGRGPWTDLLPFHYICNTIISMGKITLKTANRATTVKRSVVRKAVSEAFHINSTPRVALRKAIAKRG